MSGAELPLRGDEFLLETGLESRQQLKDEFGCVIRCLESISGTHATEEEWDARFDQMQDGSIRKVPRTYYAGLIWHETDAFKKLIQKIRNNDSPLGNFLKDVEVTYKVFTSKELVRAVRSNEKIVAFFYVGTGTRDRLHAAHVGVRGLNDNELFSLSDPSGAKILKTPYTAALVFKPKITSES